MILISHRGNISGKKIELENNPSYIQSTLNLGYEVEIDVWFKNGEWWLGHDKPEHKISIDYFSNKPFWIHAKNMEAFCNLQSYTDLNYFWHQEDDYTLTSKKYIWAYPGKCVLPVKKSIAVLPEIYNNDIKNFSGICSDYIQDYK
ncbi:hypothetical protein N9N29_01560 [Amylibacter sp.]|nr:hypothetical protein [Amylibacter sp.]